MAEMWYDKLQAKKKLKKDIDRCKDREYLHLRAAKFNACNKSILKLVGNHDWPDSMEWVQSALFLRTVKKLKLHKDIRRAIYAYTSAMVESLENILTRTDVMAREQDTYEAYKWAAEKLRIAINKHLRLMSKLEEMEGLMLPPADEAGKKLAQATNRPDKEDRLNLEQSLLDAPFWTQAEIDLQKEYREKGYIVPGFTDVNYKP